MNKLERMYGILYLIYHTIMIMAEDIKIFDSIVIGAGPAGLTAAIYLLRDGKKTLILEKTAIGGGISSTPLIENYPGYLQISGEQLADTLFEQITKFGGELEVWEAQKIEEYKLNNKEKIWRISTDGPYFYAKTIIIATGMTYRKLGLPNEENLIGHGISFCVTCDGAFYKGQTVGIIGGGNTAVTNAIELSDVCKEVIIIQNLPELTAEKILIDDLKRKDNIEIICNSIVKELIGEEELEKIVIKTNGKENIIKVDGIFESIGRSPESSFVKGLLDLNKYNFIDSNDNCDTNKKGIFVAGDVRNKTYQQITIAVSDGTIAALEAIKYLDNDK